MSMWRIDKLQPTITAFRGNLFNRRLPVILLILAWLFGFSMAMPFSMPSTDYYHYFAYTQSLSEFHYLFPPTHRRTALGPNGHLVCHHTAGVGLFWLPFYNIPKVIKKFIPSFKYDTHRTPYVFHALLAPLLFFLMWKICWRGGATVLQTLMAFLLGCFGTSLFYQTFIGMSSEFISALFGAGFIYLLMIFCIKDTMHHVRLGLLLSAATFIRAEYVVFTILTYLFVLMHILNRPNVIQNIKKSFLGIAICLFGYSPILMTNYLFTKNPFQSPLYAKLTSGEFVYFDPVHFKISALLLSPWHGLLIYQPIMMVGVVAAMMYVWHDLKTLSDGEKGTWIKRIFSREPCKNLAYLIIIFFLVRLAILSTTHTWWQGYTAFGGRYFAFFFPAIVVSLGYLFKKFKATQPSHPLFLILLPLFLWTVLLYSQSQGQTNFFTYRDFLIGQLHFLKQVISSRQGYLLIGSVAALGLACVKYSDRLTFVALCFSFVLVVAFIYQFYPIQLFNGELSMAHFAVILAVAALSASIPYFIYHFWKIKPEVICLFIFFGFISYAVSAGFHSLRLAKERPVPDYEYCASFEAEDWIASFSDYNFISGYWKEKNIYGNLILKYLNDLEKSNCFVGREDIRKKFMMNRAFFKFFYFLTSPVEASLLKTDPQVAYLIRTFRATSK